MLVPVGPMNEALLTVRYILAFLLLAAAGPKLADRAAFRRTVADFGVLPRSLEGPLATAIPWLEAGSAIALFAGLVIAPVAAIDALMFLAFGTASIINIRRGRRIECGCFGSFAPRGAFGETARRTRHAQSCHATTRRCAERRAAQKA